MSAPLSQHQLVSAIEALKNQLNPCLVVDDINALAQIYSAVVNQHHSLPKIQWVLLIEQPLQQSTLANLAFLEGYQALAQGVQRLSYNLNNCLHIIDIHTANSALTLAQLAQNERDCYWQLLQANHLQLLANGDKSTPHFAASSPKAPAVPKVLYPRPNPKAKNIAIIGGGIAAATLSYSLSQRQIKHKLFCKDEQPAMGASGNHQGAIYPLVNPTNFELSKWFSGAFHYAYHFYQQLAKQTQFDHNFCGVLQLGKDANDEQKLLNLANSQWLPEHLGRAVSQQQAQQLAEVSVDYGGLYFPHGGWLSPRQVVTQTLALSQQSGHCQLYLNTNIEQLQSTPSGWILHQGGNQHGPFDAVVIATGHQLVNFEQTRHCTATQVKGQVSQTPSRGELSQLKKVLCSQGYLTPQNNDKHCFGATYDKDITSLEYSYSAQQANLDKMQQSFGEQSWLKDFDISGKHARIGVRMVVRDHMPLVGLIGKHESLQQLEQLKANTWFEGYDVHQGLYSFAGLGSRGLSTAPLLAELLTSELLGEQAPASQAQLNALHPNRNWVRKGAKLRRGMNKFR
ncbi:FAD-dependent 5-carboxymethylaminomethyl-2-thiouridine(34) oxidoreductase MnmC [Paraferrimonas sp. SM1919]|uniref:FAD-dependent 5-carboxymethylaminomethyl-2-thiouridine(34) oxidoreductase MnmC n=1 Tax=Paraferrimonas sp. SM1919 TaxID=2662263 RepID=UPI0013D1A2B6|nr:FAD-dependent 5-carboxymethylaminomethyl-2-thiouridine(34) oxidoreductase MnmC [Paraferrimonas sp. SM1919]